MKFSVGNKEIDFQINKETGEVFCTSLDVARVFEKNHRDVLRNIDSILEQIRKIGDLEQLRNFAQSSYKQNLGFGATRDNRAYNLTRDGFSLLAMSFTGEEALRWKLCFLKAFNFMERELRSLKESAQASLEHPKEVFNLIYETPCRDAVLNAVSKMEKENNTRVKSVRSYKILEEFDGKTINNVLDIGINWDTPSSLTKKQEIALASGKVKVIKR